MQLRAGLTPWTLATVVVVLLTTLPWVSVLAGVVGESSDTWRHLADTVLVDYVVNSLLLMLGVGALSLVLGVSTAWLVAGFDFPGRRIFQWALILPLAIPTYIIAYTYAEIFDYAGPVQSMLAGVWPAGTDVVHLRTLVTSLPGVAVLLALVLYPYVYLVTRASFLRRTAGMLETARILGQSSWQTFRRVALPLARPAIVAGLTLVLMEVLNEYGAVKYFGIPTFTTGIFRAWFPLNDADAALRLAGLLLLFVFVLVGLERLQRGRARFDEGARGSSRPPERARLGGWKRWGAFAVCAVPVVFGFLVPVAQLAAWAGMAAHSYVDRDFLVLTANTFGLAVAAAAVAVVVALLVAYSARLSPTPLLRAASRLASLGYAVPGAVIAVGVFIPFLWIDRQLGGVLASLTGERAGLILTGTVGALVFAYVVRFLAVALNPVRSGFERTCGNLDDTSRSLGSPPLRTLLKVDLPLLKGTLLSAAILVFVDVLKELPLTLILRPFNFDTLATRAYQLATDELVTQSAIPALLIVVVGLVPVILLSRLMEE